MNYNDRTRDLQALADALGERCDAVERVHVSDDRIFDLAAFTFHMRPGWIIPSAAQAFVAGLIAEPPSPRVSALAREFVQLLNKDVACVSYGITEQVLREVWPRALSRRIEDLEARASFTTAQLTARTREAVKATARADAYAARVRSIKQTRALPVNPADPRTPPGGWTCEGCGRVRATKPKKHCCIYLGASRYNKPVPHRPTTQAAFDENRASAHAARRRHAARKVGAR